jgi:biopolymer transport protein TolQ
VLHLLANASAPSALTEAPVKSDVLEMVLASGGVVLAVLLVLVALSGACWLIIGVKAVAIGGAIRRSRAFIDTFRRATRLAEFYKATEALPASPAREMFRAGYEELELILNERQGRSQRPRGDGPAAAPESMSAAFENIQRSLERSGQLATAELERYLGFLATVGSAAPFIGLFGTVWGIMNAFGDIDPNLPILQTVTPHIAEALVATAIGLLAAIPSVMGYNWLNGRMRRLDVHLHDFSSDYLNVLRRHFFS